MQELACSSRRSGLVRGPSFFKFLRGLCITLSLRSAEMSYSCWNCNNSFCFWSYTTQECSRHIDNVFHLWLLLWLYTSEWGLSLVCCQHSQQKHWEKHTKHLARDHGANTFALRSHVDHNWRPALGFLKVLCGWKPYGLTLCYITLHPHHLPGGPGV